MAKESLRCIMITSTEREPRRDEKQGRLAANRKALNRPQDLPMHSLQHQKFGLGRCENFRSIEQYYG